MTGIRESVEAAVAVLVIGCGGGGATDMAPDSGPPTPIVGRVFSTCHQVSADVDVPFDLSRHPVRALVPDGSASGFRAVAGTTSADGTFMIDGVPANTTYLLQLDDPPTSPTAGTQLFVTDQRSVELHSEQVRRCTPAPVRASEPASVDIDLTGMTPFKANSDDMELASHALGYSAAVSFGVGAGDVFHNSVQWPQNAPLVDAAAGDDLHVLHVRRESGTDPTTSLPRTITRTLDWFDATGTSLQVGPATAITGQFPATAPSQSVSLSIDHDRFMAGHDAGTEPGLISVQLTVNPLSVVGTVSGRASVVFRLSLFTGSAIPHGISTASFTYSDPFPPSWKRALSVDYGLFRFVRLSATTDTSLLGGYSQRVGEPSHIVAEPQMPPPEGITIAGADFLAGGKIAFDGQAPITVHWSPVPSANVYELVLIRSLNNPDLSFDAVFGDVITADTTLTLPATLFVRGGIYQLALTAIQTPTDYAAGQLFPAPIPQIATTTLSGRFRFTTTCGDGVVDADEECDTRGESATCNIDCTTAMCGDGLRNAAAGEACDSYDSVGCNRNCTLRASP